MTETIIITGGLGHIGSALIRNENLIRHFKEIVIIDNLSTQRYSSVFRLPTRSRYRLIQGDVQEVLKPELVAGSSAIIHLAAATDPTASSYAPEQLFENNLRITSHVTSICEQTQTPMVFPSSTSVYSCFESLIDEECTVLNPTSPYAQCKLEEERIILNTLGRGKVSIFRLGTVFGVSPGMRFHTAVNKFCWQASCGLPVEVWSTALDQRRPYLAVHDAVAMLSKTVIERLYGGDVINAVSTNSTVKDVLSAIESTGVELAVRLIDSPIMNHYSFSADVSRAMKIGFTFSGDLQTGVEETMQLLNGLSQ